MCRGEGGEGVGEREGSSSFGFCEVLDTDMCALVIIRPKPNMLFILPIILFRNS